MSTKVPRQTKFLGKGVEIKRPDGMVTSGTRQGLGAVYLIYSERGRGFPVSLCSVNSCLLFFARDRRKGTQP